MTLTRLPGATPPDPGPGGTGYRLALDLGTNSIGWALYDLDANGDPCAIRRLGSRIFSDGRNPKDGASLAVGRRQARQMRRRRDRYIQRRTRFMNALVRHGLMPEDREARKALEGLDPYELRARGLTERLKPFELGRALFHLNQRRGFKSNRVVDKEDEKETGKIKGAISELERHLDRERSLGAFLYERKRRGEGTRARMRGEGAKTTYDFYVHRDMIAWEFDALWTRQTAFRTALLTDEARTNLRDILLFQRPLRPVAVGRCTVEPDDTRAPWALPIAQRFRVLQEVNHLRVQAPGTPERALTLEERNQLRDKLLGQKDVDFDALHKALGLPEGFTFQAGFVRRAKLKGDETASRLRGKGLFSKAWDALSADEQAEVVEKLISDETDEEAVAAWLRERFGLAEANARKVATTRLPQGHCRFGRKALARIVPYLDAEVVTLDKAVERAGYDPHFRPDKILPALPYYAIPLAAHVMPAATAGDPLEREHGRIGNPTVHVALNQVRKVVNAIIARHGHPAEIVVELARELKSSKAQKDEYRETQKKNTERNARHAAELAELGQENNGENRLRLRLWEELNPDDPLDRRCVYTGEQIGKRRLFLPEVEIDHILPFSRTLDDGAGNKTVSLRRANRDKAQKSPSEAFDHSPSGYDWDAIVARAAALPPNKRWRFGPDAMERFEQEDGELKGFLARHLNDTRYLSRIAREYLSLVCPPERVWVTPGRLTEMLRGKWGVNKLLGEQDAKNRNDHRHHAIDAAVVGVTDRSTLMKVSHAAGQAEIRGAGRVLESLGLPWPDFYRDLEAAVGRIVVSHKPEHGVAGQLHEETAYGRVGGPDAKGYLTLQVHKPLSGVGPGDLKDIADDNLRERVIAATARLSGPDFKRAVADFAGQTGIRRVRVTAKKQKKAVIPVGEPAYKFYPGGSNHCVEIVRAERRGKAVWEGEFVTTFEANQKPYQAFRRDAGPYRTTSFSGKPLVMRLIAGDAVALERPEDQGRRTIWRVVKLNATNNNIVLAPHNEGGALDKRHRAAPDEDPFAYLFKTPNALSELKARRVFVDILGRVKDPGWGDARTDCGDRPGRVPPARGARVPGGAGGA